MEVEDAATNMAIETRCELEPGLKLRSYQQEMLDASLQRNVIVAMDTGSGKTHVAIARIRYVLETTPPGKLVWFMSPSVALSNQQYQVVQQHLAAFRVITLTGADGVDKWTDQRLWDAALSGVHVVVGTPAVLSDALSHGFVRMDRLSLLIFDEAHRCIKKSPMNTIMKDFYHPSKASDKCVPHILGLSASPVMGSKQGNLEELEANLDAIAITPKLERAALQQHVHPPQILISTFESSAELTNASPLCDLLAVAADDYNFGTDPYILELKQAGTELSKAQLDKLLQKPKTYCSDELRALSRRVIMLREQLGLTSAEWYLATYVERFRESLQNLGMMPDLSFREQHHFMAILDSILPRNVSQSDISNLSFSTTPKVRQLLALLQQQAGPHRRGIIFVEQRAKVAALIRLLEIHNMPYKVGGFVGTSNNKAREMSLADLAEAKQYEQDLKDFRSGVKNLIIATNVLEEGIDVSACNLVICFDLPRNLVSFVQRRGRARQKDSTYCLFIANNDLKSNPRKWEELEANMKDAYMQERQQPGQPKEDEEAVASRAYRVESTGAVLTLDNAKAHLYHFCTSSALEKSGYVDLRPEFATTESSDALPWTATVTLPSLIHPDLSAATSSRPWRTENVAIKDAAFEAYITLHKAGLVNDNLLPLVKDYAPQVGEHVDQPSIVAVSERQSSWSTLAASYGEWYPLQVAISGDEPQWTTKMLIPAPWTQRTDFTLHWNELTQYQITLAPAVYENEKTTMATLQQNTATLLRAIHGERVPANNADFLFAFVHEHASSSTPSRNLMLRVKGQETRMFTADRDAVKAAEEAGLLSIPVKAFPKRKDFLHPVVSTSNIAAYTAEQLVDRSDCVLEENLTFEAAILALFAPSILHRIESFLSAQQLQANVLRDVPFESKSLIHEAICAPAAGEAFDYNRLEYLGDAVLKCCTSLNVMARHPTWPEGYLTAEKIRIVRNSTLTKAALACGLDKYIHTKPFTGAKWRPPRLSDHQRIDESQCTREMSSKVLADVVEALIGAAYVDGGLDKAYLCIKTLLPEETWFDDPVEPMTSSPPQNTILVGQLENLVGHHFRHPDLLLEAVTHGSHRSSRSIMSYERLEFLGDAVLDQLIIPKLYAYEKRQLKHSNMHSTHEALVNGLFLGYCCMAYSISETTSHVVKSDVSGQHEVQQGERRLHLHDFMRAAPQIIEEKHKFLQRCSGMEESILQRLGKGNTYPWVELITLDPPKFLSDLIESVIGAIYLDTDGNLGACEKFIERLGILDVMKWLLDDDVEVRTPKELVGIAAGNEKVRYNIRKTHAEDGRREYSTMILVGEEEMARVDGCGSVTEAETKAASRAVEALKARSRNARPKRRRKAEQDVEDGAEHGQGQNGEVMMGDQDGDEQDGEELLAE